MGNDLSNGAGLLIKRWEDVKEGKIKANSIEYKRLQIDTTIYTLESQIATRVKIEKLENDNWVGVVKQYPRASFVLFTTYNALIVSDIRHPFLNWLSAVIIQLFGF